MHIGIAGAGLAGRLLAYALSKQNHQVTVFDPATHLTDRVAAGWTAAGMLSPLAELESGDEYVYQLGIRSLSLWSEIVGSLKTPIELKNNGSLMLAHRGDEGAAERIISLLQHKSPQSDKPQAIDLNHLHQLEPDIQGPSHAWLLEKEGQIHTVQAMTALAEEAHQVLWHWGQGVQKLTPHTIHTQAGQTHTFDWVFDCRGTGARHLKYPHPSSVSCQNVRGVRGEVFWLQTSAVKLNHPLRLLHPRYRVYIVHRAPDIIVIGASEIESEDRSAVSLRTTVELLTAAHSVIPALSEARLIHTETNLRPALVDNLPRIESEQGLTRINGLFRHGWLIAPALVEQALQTSLKQMKLL